MELSKKTTILFPPHLHERLTYLAARRRTSLGNLVREACEAHYGPLPEEERLEAVRELSDLALPVADAETMERESMPDAEEPLPEG